MSLKILLRNTEATSSWYRKSACCCRSTAGAKTCGTRACAGCACGCSGGADDRLAGRTGGAPAGGFGSDAGIDILFDRSLYANSAESFSTGGRHRVFLVGLRCCVLD